ncbi:nucleotide exchange factor GrpE [Solihabitans fulvus]|uniref:Protein GrpE n=1 Tax=Solihabitans fulvus TaxID=1892852 RepID=A0A5B2W950_9PSEU|nr:nucleotide exchange factor GrpE [Solihabitans fulvus]KAA2248441.1 nucleotide exchange factor GrpE [Solihabitans fulvus]
MSQGQQQPTPPPAARPGEQGEEQPHVVVRDRRRIDPETGQVRHSVEDSVPGTADETGSPAVPPVDPTVGDADGGRHAVADESDAFAGLRAELDERTADLQRLTAEYANYRKRVERDREVVVTAAKAQVASELLGVLDDVERASAHGDLTGAFKAVADKLVTSLQRAGLEPFGHEGEAFDPSVHEAVQHDTSPEVSGPTVTGVLRRGYRFGDRMVRPALVAVTDHEPGSEQPIVDVPVDEQA